ncbi:MAG TPA: hypothetical protein VFT99_10740, partial [Roseiflexaceae bacterium]|nr:hypothetical protein [Roseiflexaceae bacterium]
MWPSSLSLRLRLTLALGLLSGVMAVSFGLLAVPLIHTYLLNAMDARLQSQAVALADALAAPPPSTSTPEALSLVFAAQPGYVALLTADGTILARSPGMPAGGLALDPALLHAARGGQTLTTTTQDATQDGAGMPLRALLRPL